MTNGTLTKSATKTVLFQYSNIPISGASAEPVRTVRCFVTPVSIHMNGRVHSFIWYMQTANKHIGYD